MIVAQVFAGRMHQQVPVVAFDEHGRPVMQQVPSQEIKVATVDGLVNIQGEVVTALGRAVFAQIAPLGQIFALDLLGTESERCGHRTVLGFKCLVAGKKQVDDFFVVGHTSSGAADDRGL